VNEILGDHNVDKQITDNKDDVSFETSLYDVHRLTQDQVAYLMADISDVAISDIREISDALEALPCKYPRSRLETVEFTLTKKS
jgi:D-3-phosphoglycerate dehydrogenase